jgi:hypothetical protein
LLLQLYFNALAKLETFLRSDRSIGRSLYSQLRELLSCLFALQLAP